jgi:hypothetical protein
VSAIGGACGARSAAAAAPTPPRAWAAVRDLTGGFKCFRARSWSVDLDAIGSRGYAFQVELTYRAIQHGFEVVEVPIVFRDRRVGASKMTARSSSRRSGGSLFYAFASGRRLTPLASLYFLKY